MIPTCYLSMKFGNRKLEKLDTVKTFRIFPVAILLSATVTGCMQGGISPANEPSTNVQTDVANAVPGTFSADVERSSSAMHHFLVGQLSYVDDDLQTALDNFAKAGQLIDQPAPLLHIRLAELYLRFGKLNEAFEPAQKAVAEQPDDPYVHLLYAGVLEALGRDVDAEPVYKQVIKRFPDKFEAYILIATLYLRQKQFERALETLTELTTCAPSNPLGHFYLGRTYEEMGDLSQAEGEYSIVFELNPGGPNGTSDLLRVLLKQGKLDKAKEIATRIVEKDPSNTLARKALGALMLDESRYDEALEHLLVVEGLEPGSTDIHYKIALIQIEKRNFREAVRELSLVLAQDPKQDDARYYLASIYAGSNRRKEAVRELRKIERGSPMFVKSRTFAAFILRQAKDLKVAEECIREALEAEPDNQNLTLYLVLALRDQGKFSEAKTLLERGLAKAPENERLLYNLGIVQNDLDAKDEALVTMERLIKINPHNSDALNYIAYALVEKKDDLERARTLITKALEIRPNDGYYLDTLGWLQFQSGDTHAAEETLSRALAAAGEDLVLVEHYVEALLKNGRIDRAVSVLKGVLEQNSTADDSDQERREIQSRLRKRLRELLKQHPELQSVEKSELRKSQLRNRLPTVSGEDEAALIP